jgi:hypothetical protein
VSVPLCLGRETRSTRRRTTMLLGLILTIIISGAGIAGAIFLANNT